MRRNRFRPITAAFFLAGLLSGAVPAHADWVPNLMSKEDEARVGREQSVEVVKQFGGAYDNPDLARYVTSIGQLLASSSADPTIPYTFTVLDSPIVNAFSLPGGYVYVTRGLIALADNEAELAGVIAHEIGHVTAHHSAQRYSRGVLAQIGLGILGAVTKSDIASQLGGAAAQLALMSYSRDQEFEADSLGVRTMSRAGFDPHAMSGFLSKLQAHDQLEAQIMGQPGTADKFSLLATHPRTADRVERAITEAGLQQVSEPVVARDIFLHKIDGIVYGDNPDEGIIRGQSFVHPKLRFAFEVPNGFRLVNGTDAVMALGPQGARIEFTLAQRPPNASIAAYLTQVWAKNVALQDVETIVVNNLQAATGWTRVATDQGNADLRPVAIAFDSNTAARFLFVMPSAQSAQLQEGLKTATYSFRRLSAGEAERVRPYRLRIVTAGAGDTPQTLSRRQPFTDFSEARLRVLNGLGPNDAVAPGMLVKVITEQ